MKWIKYKWAETLNEGAICRTAEGKFIIAGEINTSTGTNDEFTEEITHYTNDLIEDVKVLINKAKTDYELNAT